MFTEFEQPHAFTEAKPPELGSDSILAQPFGDRSWFLHEDRFPFKNAYGQFFSSGESYLPPVLYSKTDFIYD